jgi:hypothetical protein
VVVPVPSTTDLHLDLAYTRPTEKTMLHNYVFDAFGPYPIAGAALNAGVEQTNSAPPEWKQGVAGYAKRFGSNFGIDAVTTTARSTLARAFWENKLYYRCDFTGKFPRPKHAVISTFTARGGNDGHRALSVSALVAPYAGSMAAVYGWYRTASAPQVHSEWATTACWRGQSETSPLNSSTADHTLCFPACTETMDKERRLIGFRLFVDDGQSKARHKIEAS